MDPREDAFGYYDLAASSGRRFFRDRADAGRQLARALSQFQGRNPLVLGIPRGGVPVAYQVAQHLGGELDVIVARKVGAPGQEELAIGAVGSDGTAYINVQLRKLCGVSEERFAQLAEVQREEAMRREQVFRAGLPALHPAGRIAIVVDDGLATGATMRAAVRSLKARGAEYVVIAIPVGSPDSCLSLAREADLLVCPHQPEPFHAVGAHYEVFDQTSDEEVERLLHDQRERSAHPKR